MNQKFKFILAIFLFLAGIMPALTFSAINFDGGGAGVITDKLKSVDLTKINASSAEALGQKALNALPKSKEDVANFFQKIGELGKRFLAWLRDSVGINFLAILKAIGHAFVFVAQWLLDLIRAGLAKL